MTTLADYFEKYLTLLKTIDSDPTVESSDAQTVVYAYYECNNDLSASGADKIARRLCDAEENFGISGIFDHENDDFVAITVPVETTDIKSLSEHSFRIRTAIFNAIGKHDDDSKLFELLDMSKILAENEKPEVKIVFLAKDNVNDEYEKAQLLARLKKAVPLGKLTFGADERTLKISSEIVFPKDIVDSACLAGAPDYVSRATIQVEPNNYLKFGSEGAVVVNLKASSLRELFEKYEKRGLFEQNLRYYVRKKDVDNPIGDTVNNNRDAFWYLNNGITIVCDSYEFDIRKGKIALKDFSIVNGCQTTSVLGKSFSSEDFKRHDFSLLCKIICVGDKDGDEKIEFISDIAEAANRQKPIKDSDLIANRPEQRKLKKQLAAGGIFYQLKRGEKPAGKFKEDWQKTKSDEIGQLLLSALNQQPGPARTSKDSIFKQKYKNIFNPDSTSETPHKTSLYKDLLLLKSFYKKWLEHEMLRDEPRKPGVPVNEVAARKKSLLKNGCLEMVATFSAFAKINSKQFVPNCTSIDALKKSLSSWTGFEQIFAKEKTDTPHAREELCRECFVIFNRLMDKCILPAFDDCRFIDESLVASDFFKADKYHASVLGKLAIAQNEFSADLCKVFTAAPIGLSQITRQVRIEEALFHLRAKALNGKATKRKARDLFYTNAQVNKLAENADDILDKKSDTSLSDFDFSSDQISFWEKVGIRKALNTK